MSKAAHSPTARLLQNSRLFSLPRPLPQPALESATSSGVYRASDTATLPYPTHQAIATPASSHSRGDWGLKRRLPAKSTKSSTPHVRILAQDNTEHITDFASAADHTQTVAKWGQMGLPMLFKQPKQSHSERKTLPRSVFEEGLDGTHASTEDSQRWKHRGPWLAGLQEGEFDQWVRRLTDRYVAGGKKNHTGSSSVDKFREFLRDKLAEQALVDARRRAQEEGEVLSPSQIEDLRQNLRPDDMTLDARLKELRDDHTIHKLNSKLTFYICTFLDLPAIQPQSSLEISAKSMELRGIMTDFHLDSESLETAPPSTHPSAGLSYLRTNAIMENHPLYGPQAYRSPTEARVVRARTSTAVGTGGTEYQAKLGVGGVVADDPASSTYDANNLSSRYPNHSSTEYTPEDEAAGLKKPARPWHDLDTNTNALDPDKEGGNKIWVRPHYGWIDEKGRVRLEVSRADQESYAVKEGNDKILKAIEASKAGSLGSSLRSLGAQRRSAAPPGTAQNANFGHALPDYRRMPPSNSY